VFMQGKKTEKPIKRLERIVHELDEKDFRIHIAGPPYVVEMLRAQPGARFFDTSASLRSFCLGSQWRAMFRSLRVFLGMLATCTSAVLLTLLLQSMFGQKIGILTVNSARSCSSSRCRTSFT